MLASRRSRERGIWAGAARYGLFRRSGPAIQALTFDNTSGGLRADSVFSIFTDREGVRWFGTTRGVSNEFLGHHASVALATGVLLAIVPSTVSSSGKDA